MNVELQPETGRPAPQPFEYRALSAAAVSAIAFGVLSVLALFDGWLVIVPALGLLVGIYALLQIRCRPEELSGQPLAVGGVVLSLAFLISGTSLHAYVYATEVPEGFSRISYAQLQPEAETVSQAVPRRAVELDGQQVFIKGYIYPTTTRTGIHQFLLVRDSGTCCFGGDPAITDRIQVTLADPKGMTYKTGVCKVAGVFRLEPSVKVKGARGVPRGVYYHLQEATVR